MFGQHAQGFTCGTSLFGSLFWAHIGIRIFQFLFSDCLHKLIELADLLVWIVLATDARESLFLLADRNQCKVQDLPLILSILVLSIFASFQESPSKAWA